MRPEIPAGKTTVAPGEINSHVTGEISLPSFLEESFNGDLSLRCRAFNLALCRKRNTFSSAAAFCVGILDLFPGGPLLQEESVSGEGIQTRPPFKPECPKGINYCPITRKER